MKILNEKEISNIINNQNKLSAEDEFNILQSFFMKSKCAYHAQPHCSFVDSEQLTVDS